MSILGVDVSAGGREHRHNCRCRCVCIRAVTARAREVQRCSCRASGDVAVRCAGAVTTWRASEEHLEKVAERARLESSRRVTHGVVISPDGRYAFVSSEGKNNDPGALDVVDLTTNKLVASAAVGLQAGGVAFLNVQR